MSISSAQASHDRPTVPDLKPVLDAVDAALGAAARPIELHEPRFGAREREHVHDCIDTHWVS
jgi:perosamine synthetase